MKSGTLFKRFMKYALPSIASMIIFSFYTIVDGIIVSWGVGEEALAAVNLSAPFNSLVFSVGILLASGTSVVTAVSLGKGDEKEANKIFNQNLAISALIGLAISAVVLFNLERVALLLGAREHTLAYVKEYVAAIAIFAVFFIISYNLEVLVKTSGMPQVSVAGVTSAALTNVVLDLIFVFVFHWGVLGAAIATGLAQVVSTGIFALYFLRGKGKLRFQRFSWNFKIYSKILPIGMADGITELSNGAVIFLYNQTILRLLGDDGIVSYTVISYVNTLVLMMISGTAQGLQPISSFHFGKGEEAVSRRLYRMALLMALLIGAAGFAACRLAGDGIVRLFLDQGSRLFAPSAAALGLYCLVFPVMGVNVITGTFFASLERPAFSAPIAVGRGVVLPVVMIIVLPGILGTEGIWISAFCAEALCAVLSAGFLFLYLRRKRERAVHGLLP